MRLALFALLLTLPLTACDPDANTDADTPTVETVPVDDAPAVEEAPGDTGLPDPDPDSLGTNPVDTGGIEIEGADVPPPSE